MRRYAFVILGSLGAVAVAVWLLASNAEEIRKSFFPSPAPPPAAPTAAPAQPAMPRIRVLIASRALEPGKVLEAADIAWAELPSDAIPSERIEAPRNQPGQRSPAPPAGRAGPPIPTPPAPAAPSAPPPPAASPDGEQPEGAEVSGEEAPAPTPTPVQTADAVRRSYIGRRIATYVPARGVLSPKMFDEAFLRAREPQRPATEADAALGTGLVTYSGARGDGTAPLAPRPVLLRVANVFVVVSTESLAGTRWIEVEEVLSRAPIVSREGVEGLDLNAEQRGIIDVASRRGEIWVVDGAWRPEDSQRRLCLGTRCLIPEDILKRSTRQPDPPAPPAPAQPAAAAPQPTPPAAPTPNGRARPGPASQQGQQGTTRPAGLPNLDRIVGERPGTRTAPPVPVPPAGATTR